MIDLSQYLMFPIGVYAFLCLIPLIIIYLIRPKPKIQVIPSIMFLIKQDKKSIRNALLGSFMRNLLFLMQLLILIILCTAIIRPFITLSHDISSENTIIVLDTSASMQTKTGRTTRFDKALDIVKGSLGRRNTLILAGNTPELLFIDKGAGEADDLMKGIKAKDTTTNLVDSMIFAGDQLENKNGQIVVVSDFINTENTRDPEITKKSLESAGFKVNFIDVADEARNIGIVDLLIGKDNSVVYIHNYFTEGKDVELRIGKTKETISIKPQSIEPVSFVTPEGITKLELNVNDDLEADNEAYIHIPDKRKSDVMLITNKKENNLYYALTSLPNINLDVVEPPILPKINHDIIIIKNVNKDFLLEETINDIKENVNQGSSLIITAQPDLADITFYGLLPITIDGWGEKTHVNVDLVNEFTEEVEFGMLDRFFRTQAKEGGVSIATSDDNDSIIAYRQYGMGNIFYYGIIDEESTFRLSHQYPIFWNELITFLAKTEDIKNYNFKTGMIFNSKKYDNIGVFEIGNRKIALNLLSTEESDISRIPKSASDGEEGDIDKFKTNVGKIFDQELIILALVFLIIELLYVKIRGDF